MHADGTRFDVRPHAARSRAWRIALTLAVLLAEAGHLAFEHLRGGIVSHHLLARPDLPAVWNGWGLLLLPAMAWWVSGRVAHRMARRTDRRRVLRGALVGFGIAFGFGTALSLAYVGDLAHGASAVLFSAFALGLVLPAYRAECLLGFVLAMTLVFGAVLPLLVRGVVATVSACAHLGLYPLARHVWRRARGGSAR
ncbi:conserved membrane hypothetical protein [Luteimonas sp. 9C]|uniref:hypothetical protein n=1 Tax=Luteimonas sp. 9C TaxID=2653148 RepID=UPI0012F464CC|nr:hypothetical protein [Luteimonas sp. 9C]VXB43345.1 conserved membrane hypothetical protein [Luteimonas sp. 9C]